MIVDYNKLEKIKNTKFTKTIPDRDKKIINNIENSYFGEFVKTNNIDSPPMNDSLKTRIELQYLSELPENREFVE